MCVVCSIGSVLQICSEVRPVFFQNTQATSSGVWFGFALQQHDKFKTDHLFNAQPDQAWAALEGGMLKSFAARAVRLTIKNKISRTVYL